MLNAWLPVATYAALIIALSSMPSLAPPGDVDHADKVAHLIEFGLMGGLLARALAGRRPVARFVGAVALGAMFAATDEILQGRMGRMASVADWGADVIGVTLVAAWVVWGVWPRATRSTA